MEHAATADAKPLAGPLPEVSGLLDGLPRQRVRTAPAPSSAAPAQSVGRLAGLRLRPWRILPTPTGTPFTFGFAAVLVVTSLITTYASPSLVYALHQGSSTDVAHLIRTPVLVLLASALWVAGGLASPYVLCFLLVLTALERRIGGARTAVVFLLGHVLATLVTEGAVGLGVLFGDLPHTSLHRLDYGISFGVASSVGALAGLLTPWLRRPMLLLFGGMLVEDLIAFTDPMTNWGHLISLAIGVSCWPTVRHWHQAHTKQPTQHHPHPQTP
ncbi:rhomboid-like protein [Streptomyces sp. NPDC005648]|uniref:rhomboid-like protein n=1 Tax=Streptomyces sp. NPDC005648 TaxID=3157044 RepID=UPI0033B62568